MNKEQFIKWIQELPDDFEVQPIKVSEVRKETSPWEFSGNGGTTYQSVYKRDVYTNMNLDVTFTGQVSAEFKRDNMGYEHWTNIKVIK